MQQSSRSLLGSSGVANFASAAAKHASRALVDIKEKAVDIKEKAATEANKVTQKTKLAFASFNSAPTKDATADDEKLAQICAFDFSPEEAQRALTRCGGNVDSACNLLMEDRENNGNATALDMEKHVDAAATSDDGGDQTVISVSTDAPSTRSSTARSSGCMVLDSEAAEICLSAALRPEDEEDVLWETSILGATSPSMSPRGTPEPSASTDASSAVAAAADLSDTLAPLALADDTLSVVTSDISESARDGSDDGSAVANCDAECSDCEGEEEEVPMLVHPDGESWDWPLSCEEKKSRIAQFVHLEQEIDKKLMMQELVHLRNFKRRSMSGSPPA